MFFSIENFSENPFLMFPVTINATVRYNETGNFKPAFVNKNFITTNVPLLIWAIRYYKSKDFKALEIDIKIHKSKIDEYSQKYSLIFKVYNTKWM